MQHVSLTSCGRQPVPAGLLASLGISDALGSYVPIDKWSVLRDLTTARKILGVSDRELTVLSALLSFYPQPQLSDDQTMIVFPSNSVLSSRAHGMAESTLRRHLAGLVQAGLIRRKDSPNGKRYARHSPSGVIANAFGFDLRPLLTRANEIAELAHEIRRSEHELRCMRDAVVVRMRDLVRAIQWGQESVETDWSDILTTSKEIQKSFRRKLSRDQLNDLAHQIEGLATMVLPLLPTQPHEDSPNMSGSDSQNERHIHDSYKDSNESEGCADKQHAEKLSTEIPLELILKAAPDLHDYAPAGLRTWRDLANAAALVCPMMGISQAVWYDACRIMGSSAAAITVACILQRCTTIKKPGAYLRALLVKAENHCFSVGPMIMALLRSNHAR